MENDDEKKPSFQTGLTESLYPTKAEDLSISDFEVRKIGMKIARDFISRHHYARGAGNALTTFGLFHSPTNELLGVIAFQTPVSETVREMIFGKGECGCSHIEDDHELKEHVTELHRLVTKDKCPHNTESWFISRGLKELKRDKPKYWAIVSFADPTEGHKGTIYQASNALYYGQASPRTNYIDQNGRLRSTRITGQNITVSDAESRGWEKQTRDGKHRYIFLLDDRQKSKPELRDMLDVDLQPYPE